MKKVYLILAVIGFILPTLLVIPESIETGNILLYTNPEATFNGLFANRISSIFGIDLLFAVFVFVFWSYQECKRLRLNPPWGIWTLTFLLGLAGGFPLFLYWRERATQ